MVSADGRDEVRRHWTILFPIAGMSFHKGGPKQLRFGRCRFVPSSMLKGRGAIARLISGARIRDKLSPAMLDDFLRFDTYICCQQSGTKDFALQKAEEDASRAIYLMYGSSAKGRSRHHQAHATLLTSKSALLKMHLAISATQGAFSFGGKVAGPIAPFSVDAFTRANQGIEFTVELDRILTSSSGVNPKWRAALLQSTEMLGRARCSSEPWNALLLTVIGLESILVPNTFSKIADRLSERTETCFCWLREPINFSKQVTELYNKRNAIAHRANLSSVNDGDVILADTLLYNVLLNAFKNLARWPSQEDFLTFLDRVAARRLLGHKNLGFPKKVRFLH
jgi:hypothetical protein